MKLRFSVLSDVRNRADLIDSVTRCHDAQVVGSYRVSNPLLEKEIKDSNTLSEFKQKIKLWDGSSCVCRLCKTFVKDLGFL